VNDNPVNLIDPFGLDPVNTEENPFEETIAVAGDPWTWSAPPGLLHFFFGLSTSGGGGGTGGGKVNGQKASQGVASNCSSPNGPSTSNINAETWLFRGVSLLAELRQNLSQRN